MTAADAAHGDLDPSGPSTSNSQLPPLWRRVIDVLFSPGELMEDLAADPKWLGALLLGGVTVALATALIPGEVYADMIRAQMLSQGQEVPGDPEALGRVSRIFGSIAAPLAFSAFTALTAAIGMTVLAFVLGDRGKYKQYLAVTAHGFLIAAIGAVIITPLKISAGDPRFLLSVGNALGGMLGDGYFSNVLRQLDVFGLWSYAVIAIGATKIEPKRGFGGAFAVFLVVAIGFAMLGAIFV